MKRDMDYGRVEIRINEYLAKNNISKNKLEKEADLGRGQLLNYCNNKNQRIDLAVISRICYALNCSLQDLIAYIPPANNLSDRAQK